MTKIADTSPLGLDVYGVHSWKLTPPNPPPPPTAEIIHRMWRVCAWLFILFCLYLSNMECQFIWLLIWLFYDRSWCTVGLHQLRLTLLWQVLVYCRPTSTAFDSYDRSWCTVGLHQLRLHISVSFTSLLLTSTNKRLLLDICFIHFWNNFF